MSTLFSSRPPVPGWSYVLNKYCWMNTWPTTNKMEGSDSQFGGQGLVQAIIQEKTGFFLTQLTWWYSVAFFQIKWLDDLGHQSLHIFCPLSFSYSPKPQILPLALWKSQSIVGKVTLAPLLLTLLASASPAAFTGGSGEWTSCLFIAASTSYFSFESHLSRWYWPPFLPAAVIPIYPGDSPSFLKVLATDSLPFCPKYPCLVFVTIWMLMQMIFPALQPQVIWNPLFWCSEHAPYQGDSLPWHHQRQTLLSQPHALHSWPSLSITLVVQLQPSFNPTRLDSVDPISPWPFLNYLAEIPWLLNSITSMHTLSTSLLWFLLYYWLDNSMIWVNFTPLIPWLHFCSEPN